MATRRADRAQPLPQSATLEIGGRAVALAVRRSLRARRLHLRIDPVHADVELVLPRGVGLQEGLRFAGDKRAWLAGRLSAIPAHIPFADGISIPVLGEALTIRHRPERRGGVQRQGTDLLVSGGGDHVTRRVRDWLKAQARAELSARSRLCAARIGRQVARVRIGDPKSRWGSCSARGALAYSWRLVLAPLHVLDYVVAHEVAHLIEPNHGRRFWRLVATLAENAQLARAWLRQHGNVLLRYG
jgi:predicted metal-dependent hydrolase